MSNLTVSAPSVVLEGAIAELREREIRLLTESADFVGKIPPEGAADRRRLLDAADDLREMFLLVAVIGEFNAGKSTFINAILGEALLPSGILPTTDVIELVQYAPAPTRTPKMREGSPIREWGHPNTGGTGIAIVDTPGTGSVFAQHEETAKSFLHRADIVIFIISAKRAFAETERIYLELAKNYGKKIIVVINQVDLLAVEEQNQVREFVKQQIDQLLGLRPPIFMLSAKKALQNAVSGGAFGLLKTPIADDGGMGLVAAHLREVFEQVPPAKQKLITRLALLRGVLDRHLKGLSDKLSLIGHDTDAAQALQREIDGQASSLDRLLESALAEIRSVLIGVAERGTKFLENNLNVMRAAFRGVDKEAISKQFESDVLADSMVRLSAAQEKYADALVDGGRAYWRGVIDRLSKLEALLRQEATGMDAAQYADQRAALQAALTVADIELKGYASGKVIEEIEQNFDQNVRAFITNLLTGIGGVAALVVSALTAAAVPGAALPPLAAVLLAVGAVAVPLGGLRAMNNVRNAIRDAQKKLRDQLDTVERTYRDSMTKITASERARLTQYGKQILAPVFSQLQGIAERYKDQTRQAEALKARVSEIEAALEKL
ncbi:MAG: dynamin family protein [Anaerolineae bacterium]